MYFINRLTLRWTLRSKRTSLFSLDLCRCCCCCCWFLGCFRSYRRSLGSRCFALFCVAVFSSNIRKIVTKRLRESANRGLDCHTSHSSTSHHQPSLLYSTCRKCWEFESKRRRQKVMQFYNLEFLDSITVYAALGAQALSFPFELDTSIATFCSSK